MIVETIRMGDMTATIEHDDGCFNPRKDYDHLGTMQCWHRRARLGDEQGEIEQDTLEAMLADTSGVALPVYLYEHSGMAISSGPFGCRFDSGLVGVISADADAICAWFGEPEVTPAVRMRALMTLEAEIREYDLYLRGECYRYQIVADDGEELDSSGGMLGFTNAIDATKDTMRGMLERPGQQLSLLL